MGWSRVYLNDVVYNNRRIAKMIIITIIGGILLGRWIGKRLSRRW